jgi:hypothetical protein
VTNTRSACRVEGAHVPRPQQGKYPDDLRNVEIPDQEFAEELFKGAAAGLVAGDIGAVVHRHGP